MNVKKISKALVIVVTLGAAIQIGSVFAQTALSEVSTVTSDAMNTDISQEVLNKLNEADPGRYDLNVSRIKNLLITLNAHEKYKHEIERLILAEKTLPDVLIAYEFLYQNLGKMQELESLVNKKESGWTWMAVFAEYNKNHADFVPRSFDPDYLERLMATPGITPDDIMLADQISFVSDISVDFIITDKLEKQRSWKQITADLNILHSASTLPRVQISKEQQAKFTSGIFTESQVAEAFVLAQKLGETSETVVKLMKAGKTEEAIMAESYMQKYN
jgi:hypothetical protein